MIQNGRFCSCNHVKFLLYDFLKIPSLRKENMTLASGTRISLYLFESCATLTDIVALMLKMQSMLSYQHSHHPVVQLEPGPEAVSFFSTFGFSLVVVSDELVLFQLCLLRILDSKHLSLEPYIGMLGQDNLFACKL